MLSDKPFDTAVLALPIVQMAAFRRRMAYEGWQVDIERMCIDTHYAFETLALAHTSSSAELRQAAMALFAAYDRNANMPVPPAHQLH
jgi:hypothetical protein